MRKIEQNLNILLNPLLCLIAYLILKFLNSFEYYPIFFGLIIGLLNWKMLRFKLFYGLVLSGLLPFISFIISYFSLGIYGNLREFLLNNTDYVISDDLMTQTGVILSAFILAPILVFLSFIFLFSIKKTKQVSLIILSTIILLVTNAIIFFNIEKGDPYLLWQIIVCLAIQLILNEKEKGKHLTG